MVSLYQLLPARYQLPLPSTVTSITITKSRIHIIILPILLFFFLLLLLWHLLFLQQILSIQRTGRMQLQPRFDAFEIKEVGSVTWEADDERVLVCKVVFRES